MDIIKYKIQLKYLPVLLFMMAIFIGCQEEYVKISEPDKNVTISPDDTITDLIRRVALRDGSFDNFIDRCSAISIKFPYSIKINGQMVQVNSLDDIETIKQGHAQTEDDFDIIFPVTIIYSDYSESVLSNDDELEALQDQYNANLNDEDIECLDFVYPVGLCFYNTMFQKANCTTAENDFELYSLFSNLDDLVIELEYPILVKTSDNFTFTINDNTELENQLNNYINNCDENDEVEFKDDDDSTDSGSDGDEEVSDTLLLTSGEWKITFYANGTEETDETGVADDTLSLSSYLIKFNLDFTIRAATGSETIEGIWKFNIYNNVKTIEIELDIEETPLELLNDEWEIILLNNSTLELQAESDTKGVKSLTMSKTNG